MLTNPLGLNDLTGAIIDAAITVHRETGPGLLEAVKLTGCPVGLLLNFNVPVMKHGIKRVIRPGLETSGGLVG